MPRPDDPRLPIWMGKSLAHAVKAGDRTSQRGALLSLGWYHFLRARLGGEADQLIADTYLALNQCFAWNARLIAFDPGDICF